MADDARQRDAEAVTKANRAITPSEREDFSEQLPDSDDDVTRANQQISRPDEERADPLRTDAATLIPPD